MFALTPYNNNRRLSTPGSMMKDFDDFFNRLVWASDITGSRAVKEFDLYEEDGKLHLALAAPGIEPDVVEIRTSRDSIVIVSKKKAVESSVDAPDATQDSPGQNRVWYSKKSVSTFNYEIKLPFEIDTSAAEATFKNGVIEVTAPRMQPTEIRTLELKKGRGE